MLSAWRLGQCSEHVSWPLLPWEQALMNMYLGGTLTCPRLLLVEGNMFLLTIG